MIDLLNSQTQANNLDDEVEKDMLYRCSKCKVSKRRNDFGRDKQTLSGLRVYCKNCLSKKSIDKKAESLIDLEGEEWKFIDDYYSLYEVSSYGRVKSIERFVKHIYGERIVRASILKSCLNSEDGYLIVNLSKNCEVISRSVHRLVAEAFIPNPDNKPEVNHIDFDKTNNYKLNLEWNTRLENVSHFIESGQNKIGEDHNNAKLTEKEVIEIRKLCNTDPTIIKKDLAKKFSVCPATIYNIINRKIWTHI